MNNYSEQEIKDCLDQLAAIEPDQNSVRRVDRQMHQYIIGMEPKTDSIRSLVYYALGSAAVLLIGIGLLYHPDSVITPDVPIQTASCEPMPTMAKLNAAFNEGGQKGLNEYLDKIEQHRQPRAESVTLQELMKEL